MCFIFPTFSSNLAKEFSNIGAELLAVTTIVIPGRIPPQLKSFESQYAPSESVTRMTTMNASTEENIVRFYHFLLSLKTGILTFTLFQGV